MASLTPVQRTARVIPARQRLAFRLLDDRNVLGLLMIAPAAAFLLVFLAYPLGLGFWLGMTDATIGQPGRFVGLANFISLAHDQIFWLSVFNTTFYTVVASALKFGLGLYLALLLNRRLPMKSLIRAVVLLPFVTPTVLSAIAFWWIYDPQFSIISWSLIKLGLIHQYIDFLGQPWNARWSVIFANVWRGIPFVAITLLAGKRKQLCIRRLTCGQGQGRVHRRAQRILIEAVCGDPRGAPLRNRSYRNGYAIFRDVLMDGVVRKTCEIVEHFIDMDFRIFRTRHFCNAQDVVEDAVQPASVRQGRSGRVRARSASFACLSRGAHCSENAVPI